MQRFIKCFVCLVICACTNRNKSLNQLIYFYTATKEILWILLTMIIIIEAFNSTSRYHDDLFNIDKPYFEGMVH